MNSLGLITRVCAAAMFCVLSAYGQAVNGTLLGTISDSTGAVVRGAQITATESNTGVSRVTKTANSGNYAISDLAPGTYIVAVENAGFKKTQRTDVDVLVNTTVRIDITLEIGNVAETISVTAEVAALQTDRSDTGRKIEAAQTANLPLGTNRNFQSLLNLVPGTTRATFQHSQFFNAASSLQTEVNGQMRQGNNYQIEGIDDNERTGLLQVIVPPIEAIETVDVSTSNFEAELGRASGAVTNVMLKSGTNGIHGAAYEFLKNSDLNARGFFDPSVGHLAYNYFGGNIGGPIIRNKVFFFGDYLRIKDHEANTNLVTIPTTPFRSGDLSAAPTAIYNPFSGNADGTGRTPFPGNQIPANLINPISAKILGLLPAPNRPNSGASFTNDYFALLPFTKDTDSADLKIDANLSDKDRLNGRFSWARPVTFQAPIFGAAGGPAQGNFEGTGTQKSYSAGINYVRVFSSTLISEFRFGAAHYHNEAQNSDYGTTASTALGVPGVNVSQFTSGLVGVVINGGFNGTNPLVGYSASVPWVRAETNIDVVNTWTKTLSKHTIKWGMDLRRLRDDLLQTQTFSPRGLYTFSEAQTSIPGAKTGFGNDMASFLLDVPSQAGRDLAIYFPAYRAWQFFVFAQDKWAVTPKLTVDLGLRWEYYPAGTPQFNGGFSNYNQIDNTLVIAGVGNNPANLGMVSRKKNFAPRLGAAYRLTEKTVIRAGFGISYTPFPDNTYAYNFPIKQNNAFNPTGTGFGPAVLSNGQPATFQAGFPAPTPAVVPSNGIITNPDVNQAYIVVNTNFKNPYVESWNFAIQQSLPKHFTLDLAYVGNHGVDSVVAPNINAAPVVGLGAKGQPEYVFGGRTASTTLYFQGYSTSYNGLQAKLDRRFTGGLSITTAYTFAKGMGFQRGDDGGLNYYINLRRNYARNDYDRTHTFVQSYLWELPFGEGRRWMSSANRGVMMALGGWQVAGILTLMTGIPMDITYAASNLLAPGNMQSPDQVAPVQILHGINTGNPWFSTSSFVAPTGLNFGSVGRNSVSGPGFFSMDFSLFKNFRVNERVHVELRGEAFNVSNTPQFANPNSTLGNSSFGFVTGIVGGTSGRNLQLGAKLMF